MQEFQTLKYCVIYLSSTLSSIEIEGRNQFYLIEQVNRIILIQRNTPKKKNSRSYQVRCIEQLRIKEDVNYRIEAGYIKWMKASYVM